MNISNTTKATSAAIVVLCMLLLVSFLSYQQSNEAAKASKWIVHTHEVLNVLESMHSGVADSDVALRGYVLTHNSSLLDSYRAASTALKEDEDLLSSLVRDNAEERQKLKQLSQLIALKIRLCDDISNVHQDKQLAARQEMNFSRGGELAEQIKTAIQDMATMEKHLLSLRNETLAEAGRKNLIGQGLLIACSLAVLLSATLVVRRFIGETQRSEDLLRTSKLKFTGMFHQAFQFIWVLNTDGILMQANRTAQDFIGTSRETEVGKPFWETLWWKDRVESQSEIKEALLNAAKGIFQRFELETANQAGNEIFVDLSFKPLLGDDGKLNLIIAEGRDITAFKAAQKELKENEVRLNAIFGSMGEGLFQLDIEGRLFYLNPAGARLLGYDGDNIIGQKMHDLIHKDVPGGSHYSTETCPILKVMADGVPIQGFEDFFKRKDGTPFPVEYYSAPLNVDGKIRGAVVTFSDITARKEAQKRATMQYALTNLLSQSNSVKEAAGQLLRHVCGQTSCEAGVFWQINAETNQLEFVDFWSTGAINLDKFESLCRRHVLTKGEGLAGRVWAQGAPLWLGLKDNIMSETMALDGVNADLGNARATSEVILEAASLGIKGALALPVRSDDTAIGVIELLSTDIAEPGREKLELLNSLGSQFGQFIERIETEDRLRESEMLFKQLADNVSEIFWINEPLTRKLLYVSPAFEKVFGRPVSDVYKRPGAYFEAVAPEDKERVRLYVLEHLWTGTLEYRILRPDGTVRWVWSHWTAINDDAGNPERVCGIVYDISERKEVERRVSEFYSTVSHELRTPLTSIRASLGILEGGLAGALADKQAKLVNIARLESDRLIRLINDILDIRKIEAGKLELKLQRVRAKKLVEMTLQGIHGMAEEAQVILIPKVETDVLLNCDQDRVIQVITNLVSNAIKFSPKGGEIIVRVFNQRSSCRFCITDFGPGIKKDQMPRLFGLFQQLDSSDSRPKGGTGLGLAISKAIVEQHGGTIGVESEVGQGSTFYFEIPINDASAQSITGPQAVLKDANSYDFTKSKVLIVEDDPSTRQVLCHQLSHLGVTILEASDGAAALNLVASTSLNLIILDLGLPSPDGFEIVRALKDGPAGATPLIVYTSRDLTQHDANTLRLGITRHLIKSRTSESELLNAVRELLIPS